MAWWVWAVGSAAAMSTSSNPLVIVALLGAVTIVVLARRGDSSWASSFRLYIWVGVFVVVMRVLYRILFGGGDGPTVLFRLPYVPLPYWVGGIRLLGPVSLEALLAGLYDGLRLAGIIICLGAANVLANPKRLLACLPAAFYEIGTVMTVALGVFPQLGDSVVRVMQARKLRQRRAVSERLGKYRIVQTIIVPVLSDALDRCLKLAASMDSRGYGRPGDATRAQRGTTAGLIVVALLALSVGSYGLLSSRPLVTYWQQVVIGWPLIGLGVVFAIIGMWLAGRRVKRTSYRPDRWRVPEILTGAAGLSGWLLVRCVAESDEAAVLFPSVNPFEWPTLTPVLMLAAAVIALPALLTPPPQLTRTVSLARSDLGVS